ncbi:hypothetical protein CDL12_13134 [Handroanthus impetiginosus]|uniref:Late embryogenesis abundant protein LEA-2 subgroup domain-containing protein n=1 Tax=Handroanthus impetiginosus TaxID=429701 RepID=A0A2G9H9P1_9LAMI|nr:hypothetical protein CDL12_13134 [Handroanthus impetiginosus]
MGEFDALFEIPTSKAGCLCYIPTLAIILWIGLSFNLKGPRCFIKEFYVPALDLSQPTTSNTTNPFLFFDLALKNILDDHSIRYGEVNLTFSYNRTPVANYIVPKFYQGTGKTALRRDVVETRGMPWDDALKVVNNGSKAVFRVDLAARPRFRFWFLYSKKKGVRIGADVEVEGTGLKVKKKDIRLNSADSKRRIGGFVLFLSLLVTSCLLY